MMVVEASSAEKERLSIVEGRAESPKEGDALHCDMIAAVIARKAEPPEAMRAARTRRR